MVADTAQSVSVGTCPVARITNSTVLSIFKYGASTILSAPHRWRLRRTTACAAASSHSNASSLSSFTRSSTKPSPSCSPSLTLQRAPLKQPIPLCQTPVNQQAAPAEHHHLPYHLPKQHHQQQQQQQQQYQVHQVVKACAPLQVKALHTLPSSVPVRQQPLLQIQRQLLLQPQKQLQIQL